MSDVTLNVERHESIRLGVQLSLSAIVWLLFSSAIAIGLGISENSLLLLAFGVTGLVHAVGSTALMTRSWHHEQDAMASAIALGLVAITAVVAMESARRIVLGTHENPMQAGVLIAAASSVILGVLATRDLEIANTFGNKALFATGWLSWTSAMLGALTVVGASLTMLGLWWADPLAAAFIAAGALTSVLLLHVEQHWREH